MVLAVSPPAEEEGLRWLAERTWISILVKHLSARFLFNDTEAHQTRMRLHIREIGFVFENFPTSAPVNHYFHLAAESRLGLWNFLAHIFFNGVKCIGYSLLFNVHLPLLPFRPHNQPTVSNGLVKCLHILMSRIERLH